MGARIHRGLSSSLQASAETRQGDDSLSHAAEGFESQDAFFDFEASGIEINFFRRGVCDAQRLPGNFLS